MLEQQEPRDPDAAKPHGAGGGLLNGRATVQNLSFPVKTMGLLSVLIALSSCAGCGYSPAYPAREASERYRITAAPPKVARPDAVQEVLAGARAELSRTGALAMGRGYPRVVVEVLRVDEKAAGIVAGTVPATGEQGPVARGSAVAVLGRAWVERHPGAGPSLDTGDMRRVEYYASAQDPAIEALRHDAAVRAAARQLGRALARRVLGAPEPDIEPMRD
jgi:hypothetical protein